jgi:hypothetical protein
MSQLSRTQTAKLAAEIAASAPAKEWDSVPELKNWREQIMLKNGERKSMTFSDLVTKYKDIDAEIKYRKGILADIKTSLTAAMLLSGETEVVCENYPVQYITRKGSRKIVPEKLLELGVSADTIAKATVIGDESHFVTIGKPKKDKN